MDLREHGLEIEAPMASGKACLATPPLAVTRGFGNILRGGLIQAKVR